MPVTWLHVSDFHIHAGDPYDRNVVLNAFVASVRRMREKDGRKADLIFATGDIAFSGKPAEYELAARFFDELLDAAGVERKHLFVIPGNHDVDRKLGRGLARTLETREEADEYFDPAIPKIHLTQKLGAFVKWHDGYFAGIRSTSTDTTCGPVELLEIGGAKVGILPLNSALFCQGEDDHAKLLLGRRALGPALDDLRALNADINIALVHHPLDWLSDIDESNVRTALEKNVDLILRGHLHKSDVRSTVSASGGILHLAAGAAYQTRKWPNRALYCTLHGDVVTVFPVRYEDEPDEVWTADPSLFPEDSASSYQHTFSISRLSASPAAPVPYVAPAPAANPQFRSNIPARYNLPFVGRDSLLDDISAAFADTSTEAVLVLHGQPGVGKSELAREYARRHRQRYPGGTFLIRAGGGELVDLARIGKVQLGLELPADLSIKEQGERTLLSLGPSPVLLIYDGVASDEAVKPWLPPFGIPYHVLITTVFDHWGPEWRTLRIEPLSYDTSVELIEAVAGAVVAERFGEALATMAEGLPMQICPAATTLAYEERRGRLDSVRLEMSDEARESFRVPYESLGNAERLLLHGAAFLNLQSIIREELFHQLEAAVGWSEAEFRERLDACLDLHLLEGGEELRMHQLFASFVYDAVLPARVAVQLRLVREAQRNRVLEVARELRDNPADSDWAARLNGFRLRPQEWVGGGEISTGDGCTVGRALYEIGRFEEARPWFERAVKEGEQGNVHGRVDHASLGISLHEVGYCLSRVGKYEEALPWYERAVTETEQGDVDGQIDHTALSISLFQVGYCLSLVRKYEEARPWYERAIEEAKQGAVDGRVDHQSVGKSLHGVAYGLSEIGEFEEALPWYERAVEEIQQGDLHGQVNHRTLGTSLYQVGYCLLRTGKYREARPWFERSVEETQQGDVHGRVDHESVGASLHAVGDCLSRVGEYEEARPWFERAVIEAQQGDVHGRMNHTRLGISLYQMGYCLSRVGKDEEALPWYERAVEEKRQGDIFGQIDNASLRLSFEAGAACLRELGRAEEAQEWEDAAAAAKLEADSPPDGSDVGQA